MERETDVQPPTTTEGKEPLTTESGKADPERLENDDYIYAAHMGLVQLFVDVNDSPDDDSFTDPIGLEATSPLPLYSDGDDEDEDREASEDEDSNDEDVEEDYWRAAMGVWGRRTWDEWSEDDDDDDDYGDEGEDAIRTHRFTADPTLDTDARRATVFGRSASYAEILLTRQFRTCVFSLSVSGIFVRFLRWDHEGVVVSEAVDYKADPTPLTAFLWAFASASDSGRGWDGSAQPSHDPQDEDIFRSKVTGHVMRQLGLEWNDPGLVNKVKEHYQEHVIMKLLVPSVELEGEPLQVLVSRPCFTSCSPIGRSTRGYRGVVVMGAVEDLEVVFVKDVWRSNVEGEREGDILHHLHENGVRNIPPLIVHGDVEDSGESHANHSFPLSHGSV